MSECRRALLKYDNFDRALEFLQNEAIKEQEENITGEEQITPRSGGGGEPEAEKDLSLSELTGLPEEGAALLGQEIAVAIKEAPGKIEAVKKKTKKKLKGGVVVARLSKDGALLLEMNCQSVTLTRNEDFHNLVDSVANIVFENLHSLVTESKVTLIQDILGSIQKLSLSTNEILSMKGGGGESEEKDSKKYKRQLTVKRVLAEGKAKLGEALLPKRCVIYCPLRDKDDENHRETTGNSFENDHTTHTESSDSPLTSVSSSAQSSCPSSSSSSSTSNSARPPHFHFGFYVHPSSVRGGLTQRPLNGRYGALVAIAKLSDAVSEKHFNLVDVGRKLAQHVVGMNPKSLGEHRFTDSLSQTQALRDKNHLSEFGQETRLLEQEFLLDPSFLVKEYLFINGVRVVDFVRFECVGK